MIYSDKQYTISSAQRSTLQEALAAAKERASDQAWLKQAEIDGLKSQIADIDAELAEYDLLKSGQVSFSKTYALEELPRVLVQARIASGMSQTDLAEKLRMKPQQVQRYEATDYMGASLGRLIEISKALGVKASGSFEGPKQAGGSVFALEVRTKRERPDLALNKQIAAEVIKRLGWDTDDATLLANVSEKVKDIRKVIG